MTIPSATRAAALRHAWLGTTLALICSPAVAQLDIAGDWDQPGGGIFGFLEESLDRGGGPDLGD